MLCVHLIEKQHNLRLKMATAEAITPHASFTICVVSVLITIASPKAVLKILSAEML